jgi:DinB superfamily
LDPNFQKTYDKLERQREQILGMIKNLPEDVYRNSPSDKWSVAQIVTHLFTSERLSIGYMKKKSLGIEALKNSGLKQVLVSGILKISQRFPFRYKAPRVIVENTPEALSVDEITSRWNKSRSDLKEFLEGISKQHARRLIFKHPIAGMLNADQAMKFMYEHINHHLPQIKRLLN